MSSDRSQLDSDNGSEGKPKPRSRWPVPMAVLTVLGLIAIRPWTGSMEVSGDAESVPRSTSVDDDSQQPPVRLAGPNDPKALEPMGRLTVRPEKFLFQPGKDMTRHRVRLYGAEGDLRWSSEELSGNSCVLPATVVLEEGRYFWQVVGDTRTSSDSKNRPASPLVEFELYHAT
ncbi:MAG: hypothetical protein ABI672_06685 [Vicinamibacteria bacterium]